MSINNTPPLSPFSYPQEGTTQISAEQKQAAIAQVSQNGLSLRDLSAELQNDGDIVLAAVTQNGRALRWASEALQNDYEIVLTAVTQNGLALEFASEELRNDRDIVLAAITQNGWALQHASKDLRGDYSIALAAVTREPRVFGYVDEELYEHPDILLVMATQYPATLQDTSEAPRDDNNFIFSPVTQNGMALQFANTPQEQSPRARFAQAVTDPELKELDLNAFDSSLQPHLTNWFTRLLQTKTFENKNSASILANQVYSLLAYAQKNDEFKSKLTEELENAQMSCSDSSLVIYHTLSTAKKLMEVSTESQENVLKLCQGLYKLSLLETKAFEHFQKQGGDQISIALGLQARLRDALDLPIDFDEVRFDQAWLGLTDELVSSSKSFVMNALQDHTGFIEYLTQLEPWKTYLLKNEEVNTEHQKISDEFSEKLDALMERADTMQDAEFLTEVEKIKQQREEALSACLKKHTQLIVDSTKISTIDESALAGSSSTSGS